MDYLINIINDNTVNPMFIRANSALIDKHQEHFKGLSFDLKTKLLEELWVKTYNAELVRESSTWSKIKFLDSRTMTMFQLRWS